MYCPLHTCIIKASKKYKDKRRGHVSLTVKNRMLNEYSDSDIINSKRSFVDSALNFIHNVPLMINTNEKIDEQRVNGTTCRGLYIKLKPGCEFTKENWEGYMVNIICAEEIDHIVCKKDNNNTTNPEYFEVKP